MPVSKKIRYLDKNGDEVQILFGTDSDKVSVGDSTLAEKLNDIEGDLQDLGNITNEQIEDMRKNIADARLAAAILATAVPKIESANGEYSESVQRIGTWIDGTPVWRIAFKRTLTQNEISAGRVQLSELLPIKGTGFSNGFVVNSSVSIYLGYPCAVDDIACGPIVRCAVQLNTYLPSGVNLMADNDGIFGYIDFATSESNLQ